MGATRNKPFTLETALSWFLDGNSDCSPVQASGLLNCASYRLNVKAKYFEQKGVQQIGGIKFHFSGRWLRLNTIDLLVYCGWSQEDLQRRRMQAVTGEKKEEHKCEKERLSASF